MGPVPARLQSDRHLVAGLRQGDRGAFGELYDRYAPLVYTLACGSRPNEAEAIMERVFVDLWRTGPKASPFRSLLALLIDLTAQHIVSGAPRQKRTLGSSPARSVLPPLAPFADLPPFVFDVLVLAHLGQLPVQEIAAALDAEQAAVVRGLAAGLATLRGTADRQHAQEITNG